MAANNTLDPATCTSASEAFKLPLPQVRQFHRSLTVELDEKNARLRTLVGGSYRQLLGTAETILQMRDDIGHVEEKLGRVGKGCGRAVVGAKATGLAKLQERRKMGRRGDDLAWAAKVKVLEMCGVAVGRLLRRGRSADPDAKAGKGKDLVLAAKVLVLSRLLVKSVGDMAPERSQEDQSAVEELKRKLGTLRRKLLRAIEKTAEQIDGDNQQDLLHALSAHSLATSSGAKDVMRHFLHIRGEAIALAFDEDEQKPDGPGGVRALELYTRTLLDAQALVPRRLSEALASLKTKPLLKDEDIRSLEGLRLDVCEKWFGDAILFFTPYIRHDDLEGSQAVDMLKGWARKASEVMLQGLVKTLDQSAEIKTVVGLRTRILEIWIREGGKARDFDPSILLDGLRKVFNDRMVALVESRVSKLHLVATEVEGTLGGWREGITDRHERLWDTDLLETDISNGAALFKQGVLARTHGRNDAVSRVFQGYQTWRHLIDEVFTILAQLKKQRWDDDLEDIEDELSVDARNTLLSTDDPAMLQARLDTSLEAAYRQLHDKIAALLGTYEDSERIGQMSIYLLRVVRDVRTELPNSPGLQGFGLPLVAPLHRRLASEVALAPLQAFRRTYSRKRVAGRALWEGTPELPVQPSPGTFKLLHGLALAMAKLGGDLWSPAAVRVLKSELRCKVGEGWSEALEAKADVEVGGKDSDDGTATNGDQADIALEAKADVEVGGKDSDDGTATNGDQADIALEAKADVEVGGKDSDDGTATNGDQADIEEGATNGHTADTGQGVVAGQPSNEILIQSLFDILVLQHAFALPQPQSGAVKEEEEDALLALGSTIEDKADLDAAARKRIQATAKEYWKKTSLLFALLA